MRAPDSVVLFHVNAAGACLRPDPAPVLGPDA